MSLETVYYMSQIFASFAVLVSLIYLALQTRQTARNQQAQMHVMRLQYVREDVNRMSDPDFSPVFLAGMAAEPEMTATQGRQFMLFAWCVMLSFQEQYHELAEGMINERRWMVSRRALQRYLCRPGFSAAYEFYRPNLEPEFAAMADKLAADAPMIVVDTAVDRWRTLATAKRESALIAGGTGS